MQHTTQLIVAFASGAMASFLYFGALWITVTRLSQASKPVVLYLASLAVRGSLLACCTFAVVRFGWKQTLAAFLGFLIVRYLMTLAIGFRGTTLATVQASQP